MTLDDNSEYNDDSNDNDNQVSYTRGGSEVHLLLHPQHQGAEAAAVQGVPGGRVNQRECDCRQTMGNNV